MKQQLHFITLGVNNLETMKKWYQNTFGWKLMKDNGGITFFKLNGFILGLFPAAELAEDIGIEQNGQGFKRFSLAINFQSEKEVDEAFNTLTKKGAVAIKAPQKVFWGGYSGYIADPEQNYWELAFNPFLEFDKEGNALRHL